MIYLYVLPNAAMYACKCKNASMNATAMASFIFNSIPSMTKDRLSLGTAEMLTREELDAKLINLFNKVDHSDTKD